MPLTLQTLASPARTQLDTSSKTSALMAWLDPQRRNAQVDGVDQGTIRSGSDVVRALCLTPALAAAVAQEVDAWLQFGRLGALELPVGVPPDVARIIMRRVAMIDLPRPRPTTTVPMPEAQPLGGAVLAKAEGEVPPQGVRDACRRGLELAPDYGGPGLTEGAKARARAMARGEAISNEQATRMSAWFARHDANYTRQSSPPSPGYVAFLLWGGDAGRTWARKVVTALGKAHGVRHVSSGRFHSLRAVDKADTPKWKKRGYVGPGGAWATAQREAKKRGKNEAYARKLYSQFTGKA